jgi:hypothetical protein
MTTYLEQYGKLILTRCLIPMRDHADQVACGAPMADGLSLAGVTMRYARRSPARSHLPVGTTSNASSGQSRSTLEDAFDALKKSEAQLRT